MLFALHRRTGKRFYNSLEGRRVPGKHFAILDACAVEDCLLPATRGKLGNYFARDAQPKNDFRAAFTELRYLQHNFKSA